MGNILARAQSELGSIEALSILKRSHWSYLAENTAKLMPFLGDKFAEANYIAQVGSSTMVDAMALVGSFTIVCSITPVDIET